MTATDCSAINARAPSAACRELFVASFTLLFLELACIRWFGSMVIFLTFFTNLVLLACFLGMSVGCLAARSQRDFSRHTLAALFTAMVLGLATLIAYQTFEGLNIDVGGQLTPQQIFFGTEYRAGDPSRVTIPIEVIAGFFFVMIALPFIGLGQKLGRALEGVPNRLTAYSIDIAGSLSGIILFGIASWLETPPVLWFGLGAACILYLTRDSWAGHRRILTVVTTGGLLLTALLASLPQNGETTFWSPYYRINLKFTGKRRHIATNNIGHQTMTPVGEGGMAYCLPHLLERDAHAPAFEDVLIIGAGSGNDVAGALLMGAKHVDAVEIDPLISRLGQRYHPNRPYDDPRVTIINDDGRSYLKRTQKKYDLVVYALVDSLVLHSSYTSLRLESYLFTQEAMDDIRARLKPDGMLAMYNYFRQGWVVARLAQMAERSFGRPALVIPMPHCPVINLQDNQQCKLVTFLLCGDTRLIENAFARDRQFWLNEQPRHNLSINGFGAKPVNDDGVWYEMAPSRINPSWTSNGPDPSKFLPRDNWPFLYLQGPLIPWLNVRAMMLLGALSLLLLAAVGPWRQSAAGNQLNRLGFNGRMFFLGAGFMLLETKSVVHMALLYGSTWYVNSIVFAAVLVMILLANLSVHLLAPRRAGIWYAPLILSLLVGMLIPMNVFLALPGAAKTVASCTVTFAPIFFAGVIFATEFRDSRQPGRDFGWNVAGIALGGLCENFSLVLGFSHLLGVAIAFYLLSAILRPPAAQRTATETST